ncbi:MAG: DUF1476 domain-containing protein [Hellea sp.]|nr:DUF1476 domain-containing protein [Hellea sp.]
MNSFRDKEKAAETKFVLEAAEEFKAEARRNKKIAIWAGNMMNKSEEEAKKYIGEVIMADMEEAGDDDVYRKLRADFTEAGVEISDIAIRDKLKTMLAEARQEIADER